MTVPLDQQKYFSEIPHEKRLFWQTQDSFVCSREHEVLAPLIDEINSVYASVGHPLNILEIGCGEGANIVHLKHMPGLEAVVEIKGIDPDPASIETARKHGLDAMVGDGLSLPYQDDTFHLVFCRDVLHHLSDDSQRKRFIDEMQRVVRLGGTVLIIEPNPYNMALLGFSFLVPAERGVRDVSEKRIKRIIPSASITRLVPSVAWRACYHYKSPLLRWPFCLKVYEMSISLWEKACLKTPKMFWAYRCYIWKKR